MNRSPDGDESPHPAAPQHRRRLKSIRDLTAAGLRVFRARLFYWATLSGITIPTILVLVFFVLWLVRREPLPPHVRIATARSGQSYHVFGNDFCAALNENIGKGRALPVQTTGSAENIQLLSSGDAELALYQGGTFPLDGCEVVAPLYPEVVHVLVDASLLKSAGQDNHKNLDASVLHGIAQANGKLEVFAGAENSGMRASSNEILIQHYNIDPDSLSYVDRPDADVVISTTGIFSDSMRSRLKKGDYRFLSLDANSISRRWGHFSVDAIPKGLYGYSNGNPMPETDVLTVSVTAYLVTRQEMSPKLVLAALSSLYDSNLDKLHPDLITRYEAKEYLSRMLLHDTARDYFYPFDVGATAALIEALAGTRELLVACGAGVFLLWRVSRRRREQRQEATRKANRDRLNRLVDETLVIEKAQMHVADPIQLEELLDEITRLKVRALDELTDDEVRGDRMFSIFLMQCANVINKIQLKITRYPAPVRRNEKKRDKRKSERK